MRPIAIAGLAKLVELVKKYAAPMYAPTAAGVAWLRLVRARAKMTRSSPRVATISEKKCGPVARCLVDQLTAGRENITFAATAPAMHPANLRGQIGHGVAPAQTAERGIDEGDHRVEVRAGDSTEHQDDGVEPSCGGRGILEELEANVSGR